MGTDIHMYAEIKVNGEWLYYGNMYIRPDYALFNKLAGVRSYANREKPMFPVRGLPADATKVTRLYCEDWGVDGHTHSWITSSEYFDISEWYTESGYATGLQPERGYILYLFGNLFYDVKKYPGVHPDFLEDFRMIFWFDC